MPSPFPGMNPYLEQENAWEDFHHAFMEQARAALNAQVGTEYVVKVEMRLYYHEPAAQERIYFARGDVGVATNPADRPSEGAAIATTAPVKLILPVTDVEKQTYLEIHDRRQRRVVTVIELLSPTNKRHDPDGMAYAAKRRSLLGSRTHFVEIDLLRGGLRHEPPAIPACDYYAMVSRFEERPQVGFWPIALREPLPRLPVPLWAPDPDVTLDLQAILHRTYDAGGYGKYIYEGSPQPPLAATDAAWARDLLERINPRQPS